MERKPEWMKWRQQPSLKNNLRNIIMKLLLLFCERVFSKVRDAEVRRSQQPVDVRHLSQRKYVYDSSLYPEI